MKNVIFPIVLLAMLTLFFSCQKEMGDPEACINVGNTQYKTGDSIFFMNCSRNYDYIRWTVKDNVGTPLYITPSDTQRHLAFVFPTGDFSVSVMVWQNDSTKNATAVQSFAVAP